MVAGSSQEIINQIENSQALTLWHKVTLQNVKDGKFDLSARQLAILLIIYTKSELQTVKNLSQQLNIAKPPISRALDSLSKHGLIRREVDQSDRRVIYIKTTESGYDYLADFSQNIINKLCEL